MFELHLTILSLNLAHYPDWSVTLVGRDSLPPLGWRFLRYLASGNLSDERQ